MLTVCLLTISTTVTGCAARQDRLEIPFTVERNRIMLPVRVNNSRELNIILDTGMHFEGLLLYNIQPQDTVVLKNTIDVDVPGAGSGPPAKAVKADSMSFFIGAVEFPDQSVIMLENDMMEGFSSKGVTGYTLFGRYAVEIDYDRSIITLHEPEALRVDPSWEMLPVTFKDNNIPWIDAAINIKGEKEIPVSLYIDLASSDALEMLVRDNMKFSLPEKLDSAYLGRGLSGDIYGHTGWIASLKIGSYYLEHVKTAFAPAEIRSKQKDADGIIGNNALRRFNVLFDYRASRLYIKPNEYFSELF